MDTFIIALVLISAALHSLWNVLLKNQKDTSAGAVALAILACLFALIAGAKDMGSLHPVLLPTILSGIFAGCALWAQGHSFRGGNLGLTYTVNRAGSILLLWPISIYFLNESVTGLNIIGVLVLTISLSLVVTPKLKLSIDKSLIWATIGAIFIVGYSVCYKLAISGGGKSLAVLGLSDTFRVAIAFVLLKDNRVERVKTLYKRQFSSIFIMATASFCSFGVFLYTMNFEGAAHLVTLRNMSLLFTALGGLALGEKLKLSQFSLIVVAILGTILVGIK